MMKATGNRDARLLRCLLSSRNRDADEVFESAASVVFTQAENRMHTIKAVLLAASGG